MKTNKQKYRQNNQQSNRPRNQKKFNLIESWKLNAMPFLKMISVYLFIIIGTEAVFRKSLGDTLLWIMDSPFLFSLNLLTLVAISSIILVFTKRIVWVTLIVGIIASILSFVNIGKFALRNVPLLYEDLFLFNELWILLPQILNLKTLALLGVGILVAIFIGFILFKYFKNGKLHSHRLAALTLLLLSGGILMLGQNVNAADITITKTGFIYSLSNNTRQQMIIDEEKLEEAGSLYEQYIAEYNSRAHEKTLEKQPNVIVVQSEAFWDINKMDLKTNINPIPNFEALRDESRYGEFYVPVVGGGTSNTEFEILTGMTLKNYSSDWYMVYPNEINKPMVSLASIFRTQGYETMGIHPYMSWYYNRLDVYNHLGFNTFKTLEFMNDVDLVGAFASDKYATDMIIESIETNEKPVFNFSVTMQNHGPYGNERFASDAFDVKIKTKLSDSSNYFLKNYTQGIYLSDIELGRLVEYLKQSDEPTLLLFYGDHLPMLGEDYQAYRESDYIGKETNDELMNDLRMMAVPFIMWSNYDDTSEKLPTMNASYMTGLILEEAQADMPDYLKALSIAKEKMPLFFRGFGMDANGEKITADNPLYQNTQALYFSIYEKLKDGEGVDAWLIKDNATYNTSISEISIQNAKSEGGETTLTGANFYEGMVVKIGDETVTFKHISNSEIIIDKTVGPGSVIVCTLSDSEGKQLAKSNAYTMP